VDCDDEAVNNANGKSLRTCLLKTAGMSMDLPFALSKTSSS